MIYSFSLGLRFCLLHLPNKIVWTFFSFSLPKRPRLFCLYSFTFWLNPDEISNPTADSPPPLSSPMFVPFRSSRTIRAKRSTLFPRLTKQRLLIHVLVAFLFPPSDIHLTHYITEHLPTLSYQLTGSRKSSWNQVEGIRMKIDRESNNCQTRKMSQVGDYSASPTSGGGTLRQVQRRVMGKHGAAQIGL